MMNSRKYRKIVNAQTMSNTTLLHTHYTTTTTTNLKEGRSNFTHQIHHYIIHMYMYVYIFNLHQVKG